MKTSIFLLGAAGVLLSACGSKEQTASVASTESQAVVQRHIPLDGQSNFRDVGGYRTADGRMVKTGMIYRSGELPRLSDADVEELERLKIGSVVSFLTPSEIDSRGEDRLPVGVERIDLPIDVDLGQGASIDGLIEARKTGDFSQIPGQLNPDIHRILAREARAPYAQLLRHLVDSGEKPVVFHCSHGVHRTGTATALLLSALGVPWETVREDYLLSNIYRKEEVAKRTEQLKQLHAKNTGIDPEDVDMTNINAFYILDGSYIDASLDEAVQEYGSMENYIREGLGISDEEIAKLQALYLDGSQ